MSGFADESADLNQIPDEVTLQLRLPTGLAYAFQQLAKAYRRLEEVSREGAQVFTENLCFMAAHTPETESNPAWQTARRGHGAIEFRGGQG